MRKKAAARSAPAAERITESKEDLEVRFADVDHGGREEQHANEGAQVDQHRCSEGNAPGLGCGLCLRKFCNWLNVSACDVFEIVHITLELDREVLRKYGEIAACSRVDGEDGCVQQLVETQLIAIFGWGDCCADLSVDARTVEAGDSLCLEVSENITC
eukprot:CAMPEP_0119332440 /NCGR_PEP_ID=MMETSP1333-20130426/82772_1 /TAXON_ID=418940 /ORGANISM="Scyphosphaera apsteinii, Strain RCC1455" /LENGTH=157 /DNA_ID=CAMNT_0007342269 /DNA_START=990 /DNA_END=1462 /DNA_ORIENTATION=+